jgi:hypothetical protein
MIRPDRNASHRENRTVRQVHHSPFTNYAHQERAKAKQGNYCNEQQQTGPPPMTPLDSIV